jgi:acetyl-CoA carboxylase biotin carboxylase subunit
MREKVGALAVQAVRSVNYTGAGTLEFLFDDKGHFYFMEMNTRIQVEHPVTEMVTGIDLVKEQIRIAARQQLDHIQQDIHLRGHAIECRINAECPDTLLPSPGKITAFHAPIGLGVRFDTAAYAEYEVTPFYDSMIAKLITFAGNRRECIQRMRRALEMTIVEGVKTTIPLHERIMQDRDFIEGHISTRFLDRLLQS